MINNEKASLSVRKIACIAVILMFVLGISVMATNLQINNVKIILSNNYEMDVLTTKDKVSDVLEESNIVLLPEETVVPNMESKLLDNKTIRITKASQDVNSIVKLAEENGNITMEQLLGDYTPIIEKIITETVEIPYETITKDSSSATESITNKVIKQGKNGLKEITYTAKFKNEIEIERTILSETIIKKPINKIVQVNKAATTRSSNIRVENPVINASSVLAKKVEGKSPVVKTFNTSAYCNCIKCCGKTTGITSSGAKASSWYTIAAGKGYPIGTVIYIPSLKDKPNGGWFVVQDRGGAISNNKIDIFMSTHTGALQFGRKTLECYVYM